VKPGKAANKAHHNERKEGEGDGQRNLPKSEEHSLSSVQTWIGLILCCKCELESAHCDAEAAVYDHSKDEQQEESVVAAANAITNPRTVMIETIDTVIAYRAVGCPRRPVNIAGVAEFRLLLLPIDHDLLCRRRLFQGISLGEVWEAWHDARVHIGRNQQVRHHEENQHD